MDGGVRVRVCGGRVDFEGEDGFDQDLEGRGREDRGDACQDEFADLCPGGRGEVGIGSVAVERNEGVLHVFWLHPGQAEDQRRVSSRQRLERADHSQSFVQQLGSQAGIDGAAFFVVVVVGVFVGIVV